MVAVRGVLFDKDGTLFDFHATWSVWTLRFIDDLAGPDAALRARLGKALGFDPERSRFEPWSPIIASTPDEIAATIQPHISGVKANWLVDRMNATSAVADLVPAVDLKSVLGALRSRGLRIGLATNDGEVPARAQLEATGITELFDFVAGFDSGHGGKPAPGMILAFARAMGITPHETAMVGDSRHDLEAAHSAGARPVGVLTGLASREDLAPLAEVVLPDIGHLAAWLDTGQDF